MNIVTLEEITKSYTERLLFDHTGFSMQDDEKVGIIGINGTGKSTLLKIVAGLEEPDQGKVIRTRNLTISYLEQNPQFYQGDTIIEAILKAHQDPSKIWDLESQAKSMLTKVGIYDFDTKIDTLSGGQRKRAALVRTLISAADLLILDEPTNHLDSEMAEWLEQYLKQLNCALLMITHDRYFLDSVANRIVELDKGKLYSYQENYQGYLLRKSERMESELATERKRKSLFKVELEWMQRGARARSTKQKAHIQRFEALRDQKGPEKDQVVEMGSISTRLGGTTIEIENLQKAYDEKILIKDFTYIFLKNDRIGIIGPNGSGKSTLMKIITGWVESDGGKIHIGQTVKMGYFSQENESMDQTMKVIDYVKDTAEYIQTQDGSISASQMLERFLFPSSVQYTTIDRLSGGEKRRLYLLKILMEAPNVLLLDEPTNDLDIQTLTVLEDYLDSFQGIVITVSHDRYFMDRVVNRIFAFEGNGSIVQYEGGYSDYLAAFSIKQQKEIPHLAKEKAVSGSKADRHREKKLKFTYQEKKDWETIETDIQQLEEEITDFEKQMEFCASEYDKLNRILAEKQKKEQLLEEKMERWIYLNDLAEQISNEI